MLLRNSSKYRAELNAVIGLYMFYQYDKFIVMLGVVKHYAQRDMYNISKSCVALPHCCCVTLSSI